MIQVFKPWINDREIDAVTEVLKSGWLGLGPKTALFEERFADYVGARYAIGMNSGTAALHLALVALGIGPGDEVLVPTITFVSTAHAVKYCGATPVFVDVEPETLCMSVDDARRSITPRTRAIMPVHYAGHPCDMQAVWDLAKRRGLCVIEDAAHACGAEYQYRKIGGQYSDAVTFSHHAVKNLTSVVPETPVLLRNGENISLRPIGDLDEQVIGQQCASFDAEGKARWGLIRALVKHHIEDEVLLITLEKGRRVKVTASHSVFGFNGSEFVSIKAGKLAVGDYLVAPRKLNLDVKPIESLDVLELLTKEKLLVQNNRVRLAYEGRAGNAGKWIDRFIPVDERLCKILGYYVAEGNLTHYSRNGKGRLKTRYLIFSFGAHEEHTYVSELADLLESLFPTYQTQTYKVNPQKTGLRVRFGAALIAKLFESFNCGAGAHNKRIPDLIWRVSDRCKWAFVDGLMNGDGHSRCQDGYTKMEKLKVASEELANGLHYLLLSLGIQSSLSIEHTFENGKEYTGYICLLINRHGQAQSRENVIPSQFVRGGRTKKAVSLKRIQRQGLDCPEKLMNDMALLKIKKIERMSYSGPVFDLSVEKYQNFMGGYGAIALHNTGEGGMVTTNDEDIAKSLKLLRWCGIDKSTWDRTEIVGSDDYKQYGWYYEVQQLGYKAHMSDIAAAIGLVQLEKLEEGNVRRRQIVETYQEAFSHLPWLETPIEKDYVKSSWHMYVIRTDHRDNLNLFLREKGIATGVHYMPLHLQPYYASEQQPALPVAEREWRRILTLPLYPSMTQDEIARVVNGVREFGRTL